MRTFNFCGTNFSWKIFIWFHKFFSPGLRLLLFFSREIEIQMHEIALFFSGMNVLPSWGGIPIWGGTADGVLLENGSYGLICSILETEKKYLSLPNILLQFFREIKILTLQLLQLVLVLVELLGVDLLSRWLFVTVLLVFGPILNRVQVWNTNQYENTNFLHLYSTVEWI